MKILVEVLRYMNFLSAGAIAGTPIIFSIFFLNSEQHVAGFVGGASATLACITIAYYIYRLANRVDNKLTDIRDGINAEIN